MLRRDGAARRDPCGANLEALFPAAAIAAADVFAGGANDGVVGVRGSGFTVMLDLVLSVLDPVMELKRELWSGRGIVAHHLPPKQVVPAGASSQSLSQHSSPRAVTRSRSCQRAATAIPSCVFRARRIRWGGGSGRGGGGAGGSRSGSGEGEGGMSRAFVVDVVGQVMA